MVAAYRRGTFGTGVVRGNGLALQQSGVVSLGSVVIPGDTNFASNVLLTKTNSINASTNTTFLDSSGNNLTITRVGTPTQGSVTPYWPSGYWSGYFDGSSSLNYAAQTPFVFGTGDFTIEFWLYSPVSGAGGIYPGYIDWRGSNSATPAPVVYNNNGNLVFFTAGADRITTTFTWANTWVHIAVVRISGTTKMYANGVQVGSSYTDSNNYTVGTGAPYIGQNGVGGGYLTAHMSNIRIVKGVGVYTGTFTPPTSPLAATQSAGTNIAAITSTATSLLTCQDNRFKDNSTNAFATTATGAPQVQAFQPFNPPAAYSTSTYGGSGYFDGDGDYLTWTGTALGSGNFTIECWSYPLELRSNGPYFDSSSGLMFRQDTANILVYDRTNATAWSTTGNLCKLNAWNHIAVVRNSGTITVYINGVSGGSSANSTNFTATSYFMGAFINASASPNAYYGYLSNYRIVGGTAVYTAAFTPPTTPLTAIANTSLLANFTNAGIYNSTAQTDIITTGTAQVSTTQYKWSPTSMKFNGTSDYIQVPGSSPSYVFGTGDFTIECWMYATTYASAFNLIDFRPTNTNGIYPTLYINTDGTIRYYVNNGDRMVSTSTITLSSWNHIALSRSSGVTNLYLNGIRQTALPYTDTNSYICGPDRPTIGGSGYGLGTSLLNGYVQDLRITKGLARYTANFTAPTTTFSNSTSTTYTPAVPDAPIIANITTVTDTSVKIGYMAPLLNGGSTITSYTAVSSPGGYTGTSVTSRSGTITVSGLAYNNTYTFAVYASNAIGTSTYSASTKSITTPLSLGRIFILADMDLALTDLVMLNTTIASGTTKAKSYALATIYGSD